MRNHTKYGQMIVILGVNLDVQEDIRPFRHISEHTYRLVESELMTASGIKAVLSVFGKYKLDSESLLANANENINAGAALLIRPGINIRKELLKIRRVKNVVQSWEILTVRKFIKETYFSGSFEKLFLDHVNKTAYENTYSWQNEMYKRNKAILTNRCSLSYPSDVYKYDTKPIQLLSVFTTEKYTDHIRKFVWNRVRFSDRCCCENALFCSSSTEIEKCKVGCCKKCEEDFYDDLSLSELESPSDSNDDNDINSNKSKSENDSDQDFFNNLSS